MDILLVEDDKELCKAINVLLKKDGYNVTICHNGDDGEYYISTSIYDLVILDRMMPGMDGITLLQKIRNKSISIPVIMLTALGSIDDRVNGFDAGADDYIVKPFETREFLARIRAVIRRPNMSENSHILNFSNISLDTREHTLSGPNGECSLSKKEVDLLTLFFSKPTQTLQRTFLFAKVWGMDSEVEESILDSYVHFLRRRIKAASTSVAISTIRGVGYKLEESNE